jgi:hypothetical protein
MGYALILICPPRLLRTSLVRTKSLLSERKIALLIHYIESVTYVPFPDVFVISNEVPTSCF